MEDDIDDVFCLWGTTKEIIVQFARRANSDHDTIRFTAEISDSEIIFLDTKAYKSEILQGIDSWHAKPLFCKETESFYVLEF